MGPDQALRDLMTESGDRLLRLAYQLTHDRSTAEDVVQEALVSMYRAWRRTMPAIEHVEAYARRAVVNEFLRRRRLRSATELVTDEIPVAATEGFESAVVDRDALWQALAKLPARQRAVLVLRYYAEIPDREIAELIDAKEATVRSLAARAIATLRGTELAVDGGAT